MSPIFYVIIVINFTIILAEISKSFHPLLKFNDFLTNYEIVSLRHYALEEKEPAAKINFLKEVYHERINQSCNRIWFEAFGKSFRMSLRKDHSFVLPSATVEIHQYNKTITKLLKEVEGAEIFEGSLDEEGGHSKIFGYFGNSDDKCAFTGTINTENCKYYVEPAVNYFNESFHDKIIVYREYDVLYPNCADNRSCKDYVRYIPIQKNQRKQFFMKMNKSAINNGHPDRTCSLEAVADHTFFEKMESNEGNAIADMLYHIKSADAIFRDTDFNEDKRPDKIGFAIKKITIFEDKHSINYQLTNVIDTPASFLDKLSLYIQNYCLLVCFVHREFPEDVVGMAYRAEPDTLGAVGGLCEKPVLLADGRLHSLNIAAVSTLNRGKCIPKAVVSNSLVHELGHCFGSLHDPLEDANCSPGSEEGNFIMSAYTNDGTRNNNKIFSLCSLRTMNNAIEKKGHCLKTDHSPCCGNGITEIGEECDCGNIATCHIVDPCCTPHGGLGRDKECSFRRDRGYVCSPRESPCCSTRCSFISKYENHTCSNNLPCSHPSACDGKSARCPRGRPLANGTQCLGTAYTCDSGECNSTICLDHNLTPCECSAESGMDCHVCCVNDLNNCVPASEFSFFTIDGKYYLKLEGTECDEQNGRCNRKGVCIPKIESNKKESLQTSIISWLLKYWPYLLIIILCATIIALIVYITYFSGKRRQNMSTNAVTLTSIIGPPHLYSKDEFDSKLESH